MIPGIMQPEDALTLYPLPDMPISGSSNSVANKDMMLKVWRIRIF